MPGKSSDQKALALLRAFEQAGKEVSSIAIDGRKIELTFLQSERQDEFDRIEMCHDKT